MSTQIYYFTGTGNSLAVARDIAGQVGGELISIPAALASESLSPGAEAIGLVFPVYHKSIPLIIKRFVERLENLDGKYIFTVCTYGDTSGLAIRHLAELIQSCGGRLAAGFGVHMPYNYLTPSLVLKGFYSSFKLREIPPEKQAALLAAVPERVAEIATFVTARKSGVFEVTSDVLTRLADSLGLPETLGKAVWLRVAGIDNPPADQSFLESRLLMDNAFLADEKCNGCGTCARICPVGNISMVEDKPIWQNRCEQCFACLQWCPQEAIQFGANTTGGKRYHHPDVKLSDMLRALE